MLEILKKLVFYSIKDDSRKEILYFKNTVLHHFLVPWIVNMGWVNLFSGHISNVDDLKKFFIVQRKQLQHEFYLPTVKEFLNETLAIVSDAVGREVTTLEECMELSHKELYLILAKVYSGPLLLLPSQQPSCSCSLAQLIDHQLHQAI